MIHARRLQVFAVEPDALQLSWAALGPGEVTARATTADGSVVTEAAFEAGGGPGTLGLDGLPPGTPLVIDVGGRRLSVHTPTPPPGPELYRFMTLSDMHLGQDHFGLVRKMRERDVDEEHTTRGTRAALVEGREWGARHLVLKGDLVDQACEGLPSLVAPGQALAIEHTPHPVNSRLSIATALRSMFNVFGVRWNDSSGTRNGHFAPFAWAG